MDNLSQNIKNQGTIPFVNLVTVFDSETDRCITSLSKRYENPEYLEEKIKLILKGSNGMMPDFSGKKILIKPNWVKHNSIPSDQICLTTHESIIFALLNIILPNKPTSIILGDAPIQGCNWNKMLDKNFYDSVKKLSEFHSTPIQIIDFRRTILDKRNNKIVTQIRPLSDYVMFNLAETSYLDPISTHEPIFRVTDYNPDRLLVSHQKGTHKYCIAREVFEADMIISMPKAKTHQKAGITCALKNIVGINGDKDFLPHHRIGGTGFGGDCYPGKNYLRRLSEYSLDQANRYLGQSKYFQWIYLSKFFWKISLPSSYHQLAAGWHGNDTTWRMVMDLNLIVRHGKTDGNIERNTQREVYSLSDGIIGGQGNGPLRPDPLPLGIMAFSNSSALNDAAIAKLMGFDIAKIPLIENAVRDFIVNDTRVRLNETEISLDELSKYSIKTNPPPGWIGHIESK